MNCDLLNKSQEDHITKELNFITNLYQYDQLIDEPTRETTCSKSLIDHFYSNRKQNVVLAGVSRITISDHYLIYGIKKFPSLKGEQRFIEFRDFKNFNLENYLHEQNRNDFLIEIGNAPIECVNVSKSLGVMIDETLTWHCHVDLITKKVNSGLYVLKRLRDLVNV